MNSGFTTETEADDRSTALHCAARNGQSKTVQYLLGKGASIYALNEKDRLPLHEAFLSSDVDTVRVLIEQMPEENSKACALESMLHASSNEKDMHTGKGHLQWAT